MTHLTLFAALLTLQASAAPVTLPVRGPTELPINPGVRVQLDFSARIDGVSVPGRKQGVISATTPYDLSVQGKRLFLKVPRNARTETCRGTVTRACSAGAIFCLNVTLVDGTLFPLCPTAVTRRVPAHWNIR